MLTRKLWLPVVLLFAVLVIVLGQQIVVQQSDKSTTDYVHELSPKTSDRVFTQGPESGYTIITYYSVDCKYCRALLEKEFARRGEYEGRVTILYRHYPLSSLPLTFEKGVIAECVYNQKGNQGFFDFIEASYKATGQNTANNEWFVQLAKNFITSPEEFEKCIKDPAQIESMQRFKNDAVVNNIIFTPTHLIFKDGVLLEKFDRLGENQFLKVIDDLIKG